MRFLVPMVFLCGLAVAKADTVLLADGEALAANSVQIDSEGNFLVDGQSYATAQIVQWLTEHPPTVGAAHGVRFRDGQLTLGTLVSADAGTISLRAEPLGQTLAIPRADIAEILFFRRDPKAERAKIPEGTDMGLLLRPGVEPVPCQLDGIGGGKVAVSTKIGQFFLPIETLGRYVMSGRDEPWNVETNGWEIGLTDGSVFHGNLSGEAGKVTLQTTGKQNFTLPLNAIRYVRNPGAANWLPLWKSGKALQDGLGYKEVPDWAHGVYLTVGEALALPASATGELRIHAIMTHHDNARLIISRDGQELDSRDISNTPSILTLSIPEGSELTFRIESSKPYATAILSDLVIIRKDAK